LKPSERPPATESFRRALTQSTRALAGMKDVEVVFSPLGPKLEGAQILLPYPPDPLTPAGMARIRGAADRLALKKAYHDEGIHARYRPTGPRAREIFDALEDMRCQSLGARALKGVAANLNAALLDSLERKSVKMTEALALVVREQLTGEPPPPLAEQALARWHGEFDARTKPTLARLSAAIGDQSRFAFAVHDLVKTLDLGYELGDSAQRRRLAESPPPMPGAEDSDSAEDGEDLLMKSQQGTMEADAPLLPDAEVVGSPAEVEDETDRQPEMEEKGARLTRILPFDDSDNPDRHYKVFTRLHDEVKNAEELSDPEDLVRLRALLDEKSKSIQAAVARLASRLERLLRARLRRRWTFDLEEGVLDASRLARVIVDPLAALSFKEEEEVDFKDTIVTVLLDNSGSMRGRPILVAALCADILARTLERCAVKVEILGFTTKAWRGGLSRAAWLDAGAAPGPGRLSDIRYIIYKSADAPWRRSRKNLGLMLREDLLKENIDGEALLWAHERLLCRHERRKILMVISDGVPLDEATLSANPGGYLEQHLRNVIKWIEKRSSVELVAIGIGHDVEDFYSRAVAITDVEQLGGAMIDQLAELFAKRTDRERSR
jgi:cobaltochelatase CobT